MQETLKAIAEYFDFLKFMDANGFSLLGNHLSHWVIAAIMAAVVMVVLKLLHGFLKVRLEKLAAKTDNYLDDVIADAIAATKPWFIVIAGLYVGSVLLNLGSAAGTVGHVLMVAFLIQIGIWAGTLLTSLLKQWHSSRNGDASIGTAMVAFRFLGRVVIWSVVLLLILDNLGVKVVSLLAGLGVGGIAVALAVQRVLGDLLASVSIVLDKPFEIGDNIAIGDVSGTVEHVGLKSTRLRASTGEQLIVSNSDLLNSRIRNLKRMVERRNLLMINVTYATTPAKLALIPSWIQEIVTSTPNLRFERSHLHKLGDSGILFETVYWITTPDYGAYMDAQQAVNLALVKKLDGEGVQFAYPTQTLHVQKLQ